MSGELVALNRLTRSALFPLINAVKIIFPTQDDNDIRFHKEEILTMNLMVTRIMMKNQMKIISRNDQVQSVAWNIGILEF